MTETYGFELLRDEHIAELNARARLYRHLQTGAELLSIENEDENKVFGITFRTPPDDSTGLPHIMEHSVLCGSRKYPVKEPFVELMKGSLNTFLNAFTFPDKTCYPVASQNIQDFYNLVDVYLDAVFYPRLTPYTLMQEGWHFDIDDPSSPLAFKGVVFNEMKGAYSDPDSVLAEQIQYSIFPDNAYRHDSGGNPAAIPDLTFEQFQAFHDTYYHPSNARIFFYGDDDPEQRLSLLDEYLRAFEQIPVRSQINLQARFDAPRRVTLPYEIAEGQEDAKAFVAVNWMLPETGDPELVFGLAILEQALIGTPAAQLRKALIESGLGEDLTGRGFEASTRQMFFSTGLKGVALENTEKVEALVLDTLANLAKEGLDPENIAAAINTIEFRLRENNTGSFPRGLAVMLRSLDFWLYGKDPLAPLTFEAPLKRLKEMTASGERYFERLVEEHLVANTHRTTVILTPDPALAEKRETAERERLEKARAGMDEQALAQAVEGTHQLKLRQETPDSPEMLMTIPMLERDDLDREIRRIPTEVIEGAGASEVLFHDLFTNGVLYIDLGFDLRVLPAEWVPYIPLFSRALTETGTKDLSFVQLLQRIGRNTGGIRPSTFTSAVRATGETQAWLFLRGKAMTDKTGELLAILRDVLLHANFSDRERFRQMALEEKARLEARLAGAGHALVNSRLRARYTQADWASEQMGGVSYLFFLRKLTQQIEQEWPAVLNTLEDIRTALVASGSALCNVTVDGENWNTIRPQIEEFLPTLVSGRADLVQTAAWPATKLPAVEGLTIPSQVNFVGKSADLFQLGYTLKGSSFVINNHLNGAWLWDKIRVQGGAYGGFAVFDSQSGVFSCLSYRDPNLLQSLQVYDQTAAYLKGLQLDEAELTKAIIGTIGDLDAYLLPDAKGFTAMRWRLLGTTDEERQRLRDEVLNTTMEDFHHFGEILEQFQEQGAIVVLGASDAIQSAGVFEEVKKLL
jgi:Zn-dependent M16 (insulinase) family peptidase